MCVCGGGGGREEAKASLKWGRSSLTLPQKRRYRHFSTACQFDADSRSAANLPGDKRSKA